MPDEYYTPSQGSSYEYSRDGLLERTGDSTRLLETRDTGERDMFYDFDNDMDYATAADDIDIGDVGDLSAPSEYTSTIYQRRDLDLDETTPHRRRGKGKFRRVRKEIVRAAHNKIEQKADGNTGLQAAHFYEQMGEVGSRKIFVPILKRMPKHIRYISENTIQPTTQAASKYITSNARAMWDRAERNLAGGTNLQKALYKRQQQMRLIYDRLRSTLAAGQQAASFMGAIGSKIMSFIGGVKTIALFGCALVFFMIVPAMITSVLTGGVTTLLTDPAELAAAIVYTTKLDADLAYYVAHIEEDNPYFDNYDISVQGSIDTPQLPLAAYLNVKYEDYKLDDVVRELQAIHAARYTINEWETTSVDRTWVDGHWSAEFGKYIDGHYEETETITLHVKVTAAPLQPYIERNLEGDKKDWYELLLETGGNLSNCGNPFQGEDWQPSITTNFGWRLNPIDNNLELHSALDIAYPTGTHINAVTSGTATVGNNSLYGNYIIIQDSKYRTLYAHCDKILVSDGATVKFGDVIAKVGNTGKSTGAHLHIEVRKDGELINPLFALINK